MYKLVITEEIENPDYDNTMHSTIYGNREPRTFEKQVLSVQLTKEEWEVVKKAVISIK